MLLHPSPTASAPPIRDLVTRPLVHARATNPTIDLATLRGRVGDFIVPSSPRVAARTLLAYNRLRPIKVRLARAAAATALRLGAGRALTEPYPVAVGPGEESLVAFLAELLGESNLVIAGTDHGGSGFRTPVLQLFTPSGRPRGYAKIGWDPVTRAMVATEADALARAGRANWSTVLVPTLAWAGTWHDLTIMVTEPMPASVRRLPRRQLPPIDPLREVATLWGPVAARTVTESGYWTAAAATAATAATAGRRELADALNAFTFRHDGVAVDFGAWHGDWVEWNLGRVRQHVMAWDWAYAAADVPIGFDLLQFFHLRHRNLRGVPPETALVHAALDAAPGLRALGLDADAISAVTTLHRIEVGLREERARQEREAIGSAQ